jgi:hypothetical protein
VNGIEDESTPRGKIIYAAANLVADLLGSAHGKNALRVNASTPKR